MDHGVLDLRKNEEVKRWRGEGAMMKISVICSFRRLELHPLCLPTYLVLEVSRQDRWIETKRKEIQCLRRL